MSQNNPPSSKQNRRGKKRNAADQVSTSDNNEDNDMQNPRPAKRRRTEEFKNTIQELLTMDVEQLSKLPEMLRKRAEALRSARNIDNGDNNRNNNNNHNENQNQNALPSFNYPNNNNAQQADQKDFEEEESDDDTEDEGQDDQEYEEPDVDQIFANKRKKKTAPNPFPQSNRNRNNSNSNANAKVYRASNNNAAYNQPQSQYAYNPNVATSIPTQRQSYTLPSAPVAPSNPFAQHQPQQLIPTNNNAQPPAFSDISENHDASPISGGNIINAQDLVIRDQKPTTSCWVKLLWIILFIVIITPFFMAIPLSNAHGTKYCDTDSDMIRSLGNTKDCVQCPSKAEYCLGGQARCKDRTYWVDPNENECVERNYMKAVISNFKQMGTDFVNLVKSIALKSWEYVHTEVMKWNSIKEWKSWFNNLINMEFADFCKVYEMEIMVWFFILTWYLPMVRSLIIFFWSRMILPTLTGDNDTRMIIFIKLLSYFSPLMFGYEIWNKMAALVS